MHYVVLDREVSELFFRGNNEGLSPLTPEERYRSDVDELLSNHSTETEFAGFVPKEGSV